MLKLLNFAYKTPILAHLKAFLDTLLFVLHACL